jgi:probable HAF family extracellular repeat protein
MKTRLSLNSSSLHFICLVLFGVFACSSTVSGISYTITDLGALTYSESYAAAINDYGEITGSALNWGSDQRAFIWSNGTMTDIGTLGGIRSGGSDINNKGEVAGFSHTTCRNSGYHAFLYSGGIMTDIGMDWKDGRSNSWAFCINDAGQIAGDHDDSTTAMNCGIPQITAETAWLYSEGAMTEIDPLNGQHDWSCGNSNAYGMNNAGQVVGISNAENCEWHSFLYNDGVTTDLGGTFSAYGINNLGQIVGAMSVSGSVHACLWNNGELTDLGGFEGYSTFATHINDANQVVGYIYNHSVGTIVGAFFWQNGTLYNLNDIIPIGSGWNVTGGADINIRGQIVGWGTNPSGQTRGFLLTPVPEPATVIQVQVNSSLNDPNLRIGHYSLATEGFDTGMDIPTPQPQVNTVDFYVASDFNSPLDRLEQELRDANSLNIFRCIIAGEQLASPVDANLSFEILDPNNEDNFAEKEIFLDLCDPCDSPINSYNVKNLVERGETIPITVNNGTSYKLYFRFYDPEDIDRSRRVDLKDFTRIAKHYLADDANAVNDYHNGADINRSGTIDLVEIGLIAEKWLAETF